MKTKKLKLDALMIEILEALDVGYGEELLEDIRAFRREWSGQSLAGKTAAEVAEVLDLAEVEVLRWCEGVVRDARREHAGVAELVLRVSGMLGQRLSALLHLRAGSEPRRGE